MTLPRAIEVQQAVFEALFATMSPLPVSSVPLTADRYVRIDGLVIINSDDYRNYDKATHSFFAHVFDSQPEGTESTKWAIETLLRVDGVIRDVVIAKADKIRTDTIQVDFVPRSDGEFDVHAFARYRITVGEM